MEIRNASLALQIASLFEFDDEFERNEFYVVHRMGRKGKVIFNGGWLINLLFCDGFFDSAFVFTKSVAEMTFSLAYILNIAFITLYHIDEVGRRADNMISYASLFVGREKKCKMWFPL